MKKKRAANHSLRLGLLLQPLGFRLVSLTGRWYQVTFLGG